MILRRIDPLSAAKVIALVYALLGLVLGAVVSAIALLGLAVSRGRSDVDDLLMSAGAVLLFPIVYGVLGGFIAGVLALLYNFVARRSGGIEVEFGTRTMP